MLIRCEKCSTTYELDESRIPPGGAPVQCSRCEHVFRAYPPSRANTPTLVAAGQRAAPPAPAAAEPAESAGTGERRGGLELVPPPPNDLPDDAAAPTDPEPRVEVAAARDEAPQVSPPYAAVEPAVEPPRRAAPEPASPRPAESALGSASRTPPPPATYRPPPGPVIPPGKPVRKVPNPELDGTDVPSVAPVPRRAMTVDVGTRRRSNSSWVVWAAVGLLGFLIVAGTISWWQDQRASKAAAAKAAAAPIPSRAMTRERQDALDLLMRDDAASVERAAALLDGAVRRAPASAAHGDRALALALLSQQAKDQADRQESRARSLDEERARAADAPDAAARAVELASEAETARADVEPARERSGRLLSEARAELDAVPAELASDVSAVRARAFVQLAAGERADAARTVRGASQEDAWIALASIVAELPDNAGAEALQGAADRLEQLGARHVEFVRPRLLAARIRAGLGDGERAIADLDAVLKANPQHAEAKRLRAEIAPSIPDASPGTAEGAPVGAERSAGKATPHSPAVKGHSQRGNGAAPTQGR